MYLQSCEGIRPLRARMERSGILNRIRNRCLFVAMMVAVWWLVFVYRFVSNGKTAVEVAETDLHIDSVPVLAGDLSDSLKGSYDVISEKFTSRDALSKAEEGGGGDGCDGRYIYVHDLPGDFHQVFLDNCLTLSEWSNMCTFLQNFGFGEPMGEEGGVFSEKGWYKTSQFALEVIYHNRMKNYKCLTTDSSKAIAVFVPFYSGLEVMPHLWDGADIGHRDKVANELAKWLTSSPEWSRLDGHDHFMVAGRVTWDFRRITDEERDWGNRLLWLEPALNMTTLTIESSPWATNDVGVPYPTYFHPNSNLEIDEWQDQVRYMNRTSLFCFAGAPRPTMDLSIRAGILKQCKESRYCSLLECTKLQGKCHSPRNVIQLFKENHFCLQPAGDSYTRRSIFDSILSGCIPVLFHPYSAYTQYGWFFPASQSSYSVYIDEEFIRVNNVSIEQVLLQYSPQQVDAMREVVISLIPRIIYSSPENSSVTYADAFDYSLDGVFGRVEEYVRSRRSNSTLEGGGVRDPAERSGSMLRFFFKRGNRA